MCAKYTIWYKKEVEASNPKQAFQKEKHVKLAFHSIQEDPEQKSLLPDCIGFYMPTED